jgi:hypothetical protein
MTIEELWAMFREEKRANWREWLRRALITAWSILGLVAILLAWLTFLSDRFLVPFIKCTEDRIKTIWTICQCLPELNCTWVSEQGLYKESNVLFATASCCVTLAVILSIIHRLFSLRQRWLNLAWLVYVVAIFSFNISLAIYVRQVPEVATIPGPLTEVRWPWNLAMATPVFAIFVFVMEIVLLVYQGYVMHREYKGYAEI